MKKFSALFMALIAACTAAAQHAAVPLAAEPATTAEPAAKALSKAEAFLQFDPSGILMAITAMSVVFTSLVLLYVLFTLLGKIMVRVAKGEQPVVKPAAELLATANRRSSAFAGEEEIAAIAMAIHQFRSELHDKQSTVLTINRVARAYSPWSSKIYGLRQVPQKNK